MKLSTDSSILTKSTVKTSLFYATSIAFDNPTLIFDSQSEFRTVVKI